MAKPSEAQNAASLVAAILAVALAGVGCTEEKRAPLQPSVTSEDGRSSAVRTREEIVAALRAAAERTRERLLSQPAQWETRHSIAGDYQVLTENRSTPAGTTRRLHTIDNARESTFIELLEQDQTWTVLSPPHAQGTYPPYTVVLEPAHHFRDLHRSRLRLFDEALEREVGELISSDEEVAVFRRSAPPVHRDGVTALLTVDDVRLRERAFERSQQLDTGIEHHLRLADGTLAKELGPGLNLAFDPLRWEDAPDAGSPSSPEPTGPLGPSDLALSRCWGTDQRLACEPDAVLLHAGPSLSRVPARGATEPVAFLRGANSLLVLMDTLTGRGAFSIALDTQAATPLGDPALRWGFTVLAALDPESKRLVLGHEHVPSSHEIQLYLLQLETGDTTKLGAPLDARSLSWLADGSGVLVGEGKKVLRISLDGTSTELTEGEEPVVVDGNRALLRRDRRWFLFDLTTRKAKPFGDGLASCTRPAIDSSSDEAVMVCRDGFRFALDRVSLREPRKKQRSALPSGWFERPVLRK